MKTIRCGSVRVIRKRAEALERDAFVGALANNTTINICPKRDLLDLKLMCQNLPHRKNDSQFKDVNFCGVVMT